MSQPDHRTRGEQPEDDPDREPFRRNVQWIAGLASGLAGGVVMGLILQFPMGVMALVGAVVGVQTVLGGWAVHLTVSGFYGLLFAWVVSLPFLRDDFVGSPGGSVLLGVTYGGLLTVISGGVFLTLIANGLGVTEQPFQLVPLPSTAEGIWLALWGGVGHVLYGLVLGAGYAVLRGSTTGLAIGVEH